MFLFCFTGLLFPVSSTLSAILLSFLLKNELVPKTNSRVVAPKAGRASSNLPEPGEASLVLSSTHSHMCRMGWEWTLATYLQSLVPGIQTLHTCYCEVRLSPSLSSSLCVIWGGSGFSMRLLGLCPTVFTNVLPCAFGNVMLNSCPNHTLRVTEHQHSCRTTWTTKDNLDEWGSGGQLTWTLKSQEWQGKKRHLVLE